MSIKVTPEEVTTNLDKLCNQVVETGEVIIITRADGKNAVLISEAELDSLLETLYILRSPANSSRLLTALQRAKAGIIKPQSVEEIYEMFGLSDDLDDDFVAAS
jgi:antitoxin YefM